MVKYREILRQRAMGVSVRNIAFSCKCSTATVRTVVDRAKARTLEWPLPEEMNDAAIRAVIYPRKFKTDAAKAKIDHARVDKEMGRPGVTMMVLWLEYCEAALSSGKEPYMYSAFCQKHRDWAVANKVAMHIERKPAQEMQVLAPDLISRPSVDFYPSEYMWIPDAEVEGARDLARARQDAVKAAKSAKQKVASLLMRHRYIWNEKTPTGKLKKPWRKDYRAWLDKIELPDPNAQAALEHYKRAVRRAEEELAEVDGLLRAEAAKPRWKPYVDALVHLKGIDELNAFLATAEFGSFSRFEGGRKVSCWAGTVPSNHSSGEKEAHGCITRAGAPHLRRGLVEGCCGLDRWGAGEKQVKGHPASPDVVAVANKANARLRKRYRYLRDERGKTPNKAKVAVVNELVRWIWVIGRMVEDGQAA